ncbi:MAG: cyclic nucleotide-binding domain-containing protein, partial [Nocardioidaceae bacterium]
MVFGIDVELLSLPTTPLEMLVIALVLTIIVLIVLTLITMAASPLIDKRWPADEPLDPTEMLWGEAGGYVQRHFKGLDVETAKEMASQFIEVKVPAGELIVEQGDPATHFYVMKDGQAEVSQRVRQGNLTREEIIRRIGPGEPFGELAILRRSPRTASIRAVSNCTVLQLGAEDFVAGAVNSAASDNEMLRRVETYMHADSKRQAAVKDPGWVGFLGGSTAATPGEPALVGAPQAAPAAPSVAVPQAGERTWSLPGAVVEHAPASAAPLADSEHHEAADVFVATHVVPDSGLYAWVHPDPAEEPVATLAAGTELRKVGEAGVWAQVRATNGWEG